MAPVVVYLLILVVVPRLIFLLRAAFFARLNNALASTNTRRPPVAAMSHEMVDKGCWGKFIDRIGGYLNLLLIAAPIALVLRIIHAPAIAQFVIAALAIVPLAGVMGHATETIADVAGPGIGALLNAAFGNAAEIIISLFALFRGLDTLVKASIVGSIIGNAMLVLGLSMVIGGSKYSILHFNATAAGQQSSLAVCASIGILIPAVIFHSLPHNPTGDDQKHKISLAVCVTLILTYIASLCFQLVTHKMEVEEAVARAKRYQSRRRSGVDVEQPRGREKDLVPMAILGEVGAKMIVPTRDEAASLLQDQESSVEAEDEGHPPNLGKATLILVVATAAVAGLSEILTGAVEETSHKLGLPEVFVGVVIVAIVGNAAEHSSAIMFAIKDKFDVAIGICFGSSLQISMFAMPLLVFCSYARSSGPLDLFFSELEVVAVVVASGLSWMLVLDGRTYWMEGVMLLMIYLCLGVGFFFWPEEPSAAKVAGGH